MKKTLISLVFTAGLTSNVFADDCSPLLNDLTNYASRTSDRVWSCNGSSYNIVRVKMTSNRADSRFVSYAEGILKQSTTFHGLTGDSKQYFSDRIKPPRCSGWVCDVPQPFYNGATDTLGLDITTLGQVTFTLKSWGNGKSSIQTSCSNGVMYGTDHGGVYTFSFEKGTLSGEPC